jgi:zinc transporter, ZIP family
MNLIKIIEYSFFSGITVFIGGVLSYFFEIYFRNGLIKEEIIHTSIAFGGGIIIAAVSLVLVPQGMEVLALFPMIIVFLSGAVTFFFLDKYIEKRGGAFAQLLAMLMDFVPEAIALGALFAIDPNLGLLLALFIGLQNLPESFNSYLELRKIGYEPYKVLILLFLLSFVGIISALFGTLLLSDMPEVTASLMLFSSGGILYLIFQDIAPMSKLEKSWFPALGVNFGFLIGMIGQKVLGVI